MEMKKMVPMHSSSTNWGKTGGSKAGGRTGKQLPINQTSGQGKGK